MVDLADCNWWNMRGQITCKVRSRVRGGITGEEVRQMQEKAANQWMREERRGDRRGGAGGRGRKRRTARERSAKAARWWSNLLARQTAENTAAFSDVELETKGARMP